MRKSNLASKTALVDAVAQRIVQSRMRGCVLGQHGLFLDREKLRRAAQDFNLDEYLAQQEALFAVQDPSKLTP